MWIARISQRLINFSFESNLIVKWASSVLLIKFIFNAVWVYFDPDSANSPRFVNLRSFRELGSVRKSVSKSWEIILVANKVSSVLLLSCIDGAGVYLIATSPNLLPLWNFQFEVTRDSFDYEKGEPSLYYKLLFNIFSV